MRPFWTLLALAPLAGFLLFGSGCDMLDYKYEPAEIRDVMQGSIPSASQRYRVPLPKVPVARKQIGIVREGTLFALIVGPELKKTLETYTGDGVELGVHFVREPRRHLVLEKVWVEGELVSRLDAEAFRYRLPNLVAAADIPFTEFDDTVHLCMVTPKEEKKLAAAVDKKLYAAEFYVEKRDVPSEIRDSELIANSSRRVDRPQYFITSEGSDYLVTSRDPMTYLMLDYLLSEQREFKGGIRVQGIFDRDRRISTHVAGTADIDWMELGGTLYFQPL